MNKLIILSIFALVATTAAAYDSKLQEIEELENYRFNKPQGGAPETINPWEKRDSTSARPPHHHTSARRRKKIHLSAGAKLLALCVGIICIALAGYGLCRYINS